MVGDNKQQQKNSVELEASLAPAEAEVGAVAKADQKWLCQETSCFEIFTPTDTYFQIVVF